MSEPAEVTQLPAPTPISIDELVTGLIYDADVPPARTWGERRTPPSRRDCETIKFSVGANSVYLTIGYYEDKTPCEIFVAMSKTGTALRGFLDALACMVSLYLQVGGDPLEVIAQFRHTHFEPAGMVHGPEDVDVTQASSIIDAIAQYLEALLAESS